MHIYLLCYRVAVALLTLLTAINKQLVAHFEIIILFFFPFVYLLLLCNKAKYQIT